MKDLEKLRERIKTVCEEFNVSGEWVDYLTATIYLWGTDERPKFPECQGTTSMDYRIQRGVQLIKNRM